MLDLLVKLIGRDTMSAPMMMGMKLKLKLIGRAMMSQQMAKEILRSVKLIGKETTSVIKHL